MGPLKKKIKHDSFFYSNRWKKTSKVWVVIDKNGKITYYDVNFNGRVVTGIPAEELISESQQMHEHKTRK